MVLGTGTGDGDVLRENDDLYEYKNFNFKLSFSLFFFLREVVVFDLTARRRRPYCCPFTSENKPFYLAHVCRHQSSLHCHHEAP
jgi:hypothetical protein